MSTPGDELPDAKAKARAFPRKGFRFLGLGLQDVIKYFFGGNASLAVVMLVLICVFLAIEAIGFFPQHLHAYRIYRQAGQEYVDLVGAEIDAHTRLGSNLNIGYLAEVNETSRRDDELANALMQVSTAVENRVERLTEQLGEAREEVEDLADDLEDEKDPAEKAALETKLAAAQAAVAELSPRWKAKAETTLEAPGVWELERITIRLKPEEREVIREAVLLAEPGLDVEHPFFEELRATSAAKKAVERERLAPIKAHLDELRDAVRPLRELHSEMRELAMANRELLDKFETAPARRKALLEGAEQTEDPEEKARKIRMADEVMSEAPDTAKLVQPLYERLPEHAELAGQLRSAVTAAYEALPKPETLATQSAREKWRVARGDYDHFLSELSRVERQLPKWRHDRPMPVIKTVMAFFVGKDWITNSSWHDFYGLLPLFSGSLLISIIALTVAVPFSVAAAIYVNQLAKRREQHFIKPAIEFIQAIPSVVLGFFGILVLGTALRHLSQVEWLSWVPGFPMSERLTILNAGLLLAFMAVPTIFTLTEDALNNVPMSFSEASFALGASRLQTIFRVVVPTSLSGVVAAVLLGFGRIIGETMVVLLVAGNKIQIPDFSAGLGVIAQPAHTMTGIIAQELGEVDQGSLHWRALFMVGLVLFTISLSINYTAQRILKKFHQAY